MFAFDFSISRRDDALIIALKGGLNASNAAELTAEQNKELEDPAVKNVIWDVSELKLVASAGLRVMMLAINACRSRGGTFCLVAPDTNIRKVIRISGLDNYLTICDALD